MSSRFDRRPPRPSRGGDSGGGRPYRGGPRGRRPRPEGGASDGRRRDGEEGAPESSWRGSRDGEFRGRTASRGGAFRGSSRDGGRPMGRGDRRERRFDERSSGDRRFEARRSDDRRSDDRRFDDRRSGDRRFEDRRSEDRRFSDRRFADRRPGGRRFSDGDGRGMRSGRSERPDKRFDEQPRGEASAHGSEGVADDLLWGRHATQAALEAGRPIHRIWCTSEMRSAPKFMALLRDAKAAGVLVEEVTWARLAQMTGGAVHQGIALQTASERSD